MHDLHTGSPHFGKRAFTITMTQLDAANAVDEHRSSKSEIDGIERRGIHAVVGRQAHQIDFGHWVFAQKLSESGFLPSGIVKERTVTIDLAGRSFANHVVNAVLMQ